MRMGLKRRCFGVAVKSLAGLCVAIAVFSIPASVARDSKVASGNTQVVANIAGREVTINELRIEMRRLGLDPRAPASERLAFESLRDRILVVREAEDTKVDRRPEALWRMEAAREQALAEVYLTIVSQPPEPSQSEIEEFILDSPTLFSKAKNYTFSVIDVETADFNAEAWTPLFDEQADFAELRDTLDASGTAYRMSEAVRQAASFPETIRLQLDSYGITDNIVLQGEFRTSILKIMKIEPAGLSLTQSIPIARQLLKQKESQKRVNRKLEQLRNDKPIVIYRDTIKPASKPEGTPQ